jgi:outer membrane immunogenic protein
MKKFLLCSASVLAITVATSQVQAQEATAASSWDGFYFGGHMGAGYVLGELAHGSDDYAFTKGGMLGGLQLGYNQDGGGFIWGVEADVSFADLQRQNAAHMIGADGMSSIRARLGAEIGNGALAYLTVGAGALWGTSQSSDGDGGDYVVWRPVLGAGIEAPLNEHLTIKAEGLAFLGSDSPSGVSDPNRLKDVFTARLGINYHLNGTNYGRMAGAGEGSWNGWYFGAHLGAAKVSGELADGSDDYTYKRGGGSGGLQLGFNQETNGYIWGVEADASFADLQMASERHNMGPDGMASFRGKIGKDIGNGTIAYLTGGAGVLWGISNSSDGILSSGYAVWRPVVGAGIEAPLNENFTVKAEGLAFIGRDRPTPPSDPNVIDDVFVARLGINYHLNGTTYGSAAANRSDPANSSWDGVYLGAHLGSAVMSGEFAIGSDDFSVSKAGMLGGLQLGYNQEIRGYIWGLEGDFGFVDLTRRQQYIHQLNVSTMATVRGRIGMEVSGGAFAYLTAGAGALSGTNQSSDADGDTYWVWRPVVGAGLEAPINEFLTFKAEGLAFIGSDKPSGVSDPNRLDDVFVTRLGLNYHFDGTTYGKVADNVADPLNGYYFGANLGGA